MKRGSWSKTAQWPWSSPGGECGGSGQSLLWDGSLSPVAAPEGHMWYVHQGLRCEPAWVQSNPLPCGKVSTGSCSAALMVLTSGSRATSFALMLPDLRLVRCLYGMPKSLCCCVTEYNCTFILPFRYAMHIPSFFTLFLVFLVVFFLSCKLWLAGDQISASCFLQTLGDINNYWKTKTDKGLISRGQEINSKRVEFGSRPGLLSCWVMED